MHCTALLIHFLLVTFQFEELFGLKAIETSPTNPKFLRSYNQHYAVETDNIEDLVGTDMVFFVSFTDNLFPNERYFQVTVLYMDSIYRPSYRCFITEHSLVKSKSRKYNNVFVLMFSLHEAGLYQLVVSPLAGRWGQIIWLTTDREAVENNQHLNFRLLAPGGRYNCGRVGTFNVGPLRMDRFPLHAVYSWGNWLTIRRLRRICRNSINGIPTWSMEMITHDICLDADNRCLNPFSVKKVNVSEYTSTILNVDMPTPTREEAFVIMPYTLPPGIFRLCNTELISNAQIKHCAHLRITPVEVHCRSFMEPMRINMTPKVEEFVWPLEDLQIQVHDYFCLFSALDSVYTGRIKYRYKWLCTGDILCQYLKFNSTKGTQTYNKSEVVELNTKETTLKIPKKYMTAGTTVTISFYLEYAHPLFTYFVCNGTENRTITFVKTMESHLEWRCLHNCWLYVNPELPLLVAFECHDCVITTFNNPTIKWSVSGLTNETYAGANTPYLEVTDFGVLTKAFYTKFFVRVKVSYTTASGDHVEVRLGKQFLLARNIQSTSIDIKNDFLFETEYSNISMNITPINYFPQFSLDIENMYYYVGWATPIPVIATLSVAFDADEIRNIQKPEFAGIDGQCVYTCTDFYHVPLEDGNYSHCSDCTKYVTCTNGYLQEWDCTQDMEAADNWICQTNSLFCASNETNFTDHTHYMKDYVITRTLWAPQSFVLELFETEYEDNFTTIQLELSSYAGLRKFQLLLDIFVVPRRVIPPKTLDDVERMWAVPHKTHEIIFPDKSYLIVIARALELTQIKRNPLYRPNVKPDPPVRNMTSTNETMGTNSTGLLIHSLHVGNFTDGSNSFNGDWEFGNVDTILNQAESMKVLRFVEMMIDALLNPDLYPLTYSNVAMYMASLTRILNIYDYSIPIMEKAIRYIHLVHDFHVNNLTEPASDDEIISHKLETLCSLVNYFVRYRQQEPLLFQLEYPHKFETALLETLYKIIGDIAERQGKRTPHIKSIVHKNFVAKGAWLDVFNTKQFLHIHMGLTDVTIDVGSLLKSSAFDYVLYTFVNIGAYTSTTSPLPLLDQGLPPNGPIMHLHVVMKHTLSLPLFIFEPGIYDIRYATDFESVLNGTGLVSFGIYSKESSPLEELTSDCYFFRVLASNAFASTITLKPKGNVTFGVRIKLSKKLSDGLETINEDEILLPHYRPEKTKACHGVMGNQYSIFLPPLSLRQQFELESSGEYFVVIRVIANPSYKSQDVPSSELHSVRDEIVSINCVRSTCLQLDQSNLITKYCRVSHCTGGFPPQVSCRCDRGYTFSANTTSCFATGFDIDKNFELQIEDIEVEKFNYMIPSVIIGMWCIFYACFLMARKMDAREKIMGKTLALPGVFSPFGTCQYLMCVVTGLGVGCGTKSVPCMTIVGTQAISPRYKLQTSEYVFVNGSEIWLLVTVPETVGTPKLIIISMETELSQLSTWFVKEVVVRQIGSDVNQQFVYNTWLPSKDGLLFAVDDAVPNENVLKATFGSSLLRLMRNQHPVLGVRYSIPGSRFTKTQHVIFCACCVHIMMLVCLLTQDLPKPKLVAAKQFTETFTVKLELFFRSINCALITLLPIYLLGVLVETATPTEPETIEWRQEVKSPQERRPFKKPPFDESELPSRELIESLLQETDSDRSSFETNRSDSLSSRQSKSRIRRQSVVTQAVTPTNDSRMGSQVVDTNENRNVTDTKQQPEKNGVELAPPQEQKENKCMKCITAIFPLPIYVCLAFMWAVIAPVTYYIFMLGFFFSTAASLEFVYVVCVTFIILMAIVYPIWLTVVALVNTVLHLSGKKSYGARSEYEYRLRYIQPALPAAESMAKLNVVNTRTRSLGELDSQILSATTITRSHHWCRKLISQKKSDVKKKQIAYSNLETILFVILVLVIINAQVGSVWESYNQTNFVTRAMNIPTDSGDLDKALTYDGMWDHLLHIVDTIISWKSNSSTVSMSVLSAVKVRQIRAQPYQGDCEKDYPNLRFPRCIFDVEKSVIETRTFANRWAYPIPANTSRPGPFSYQKPRFFSDISTASHTYPDGGYSTLFSWWSKEPVMLKYLRKHDWVDKHTKAVIISMNFINVDSGLSTIIEHMYEFRLTGIFMYTISLYTFPLKITQFEEFVLSCLVMLLALMTVYFLLNEIRASYQVGLWRYLKLSQSWFLICERVLSVAVLFIFLYLQNDRRKKLKQVHEAYLTETDGTTFIDFHVVSGTTFLLILVSSLLVIVCLIKVLARFRDYELLAQFVNMIPAVAKITYIPLVFIIGFGLLGCLLFQSVVGDYKSIYTACTSVTILLLKSDPIMAIVEASPIAGELFISAVYCIMFFVILNYFIGLLNEAYSDLKHHGKK